MPHTAQRIKKGRSAAAIHWSGGFDAAMLYHQLTVNLTAIHGQIFGPIQARTGAELNPLQLPELAIDLPPHPVMPKHGENVVSLANVETIEIHKKKPAIKRALEFRCKWCALDSKGQQQPRPSHFLTGQHLLHLRRIQRA